MSFSSRFGFGRTQVLQLQPTASAPAELASHEAALSTRPPPLSPPSQSFPPLASPRPQIPQPPSPPETIKSHSPLLEPAFATATRSEGRSEEHAERERMEMEQERERTHVQAVGAERNFPALARRAVQAERERVGGRNQSIGYTFSQAPVAGTSGVGMAAGLGGAGVGGRRKKWLVLVVPPAVLPHSPPPAQTSGFANGYGASGRFSGGILLPLQPTLPTQLSLIAREFSLPSIGGVSLYLCLPSEPQPQWAFPGQQGYPVQSEGGMKPRLVEETWSVLWSAYFDDELSLSAEGLKGVGGLPIAARIEFDIDPRKARWLSGWLNGPSTLTSHARSLSTTLPRPPHTEKTVTHSRETIHDFSSPSLGVSLPLFSTPSSLPEQRHIPLRPTRPLSPEGCRPLSLLARQATSSQATRSSSLSTPSNLRIDILGHTRSTTLTDSGFGASPSTSDECFPKAFPASESDDPWPPTPPSPDRLPSPDIAERSMAFTPSALGFRLESMRRQTSLPVSVVEPRARPLEGKLAPPRLIERDWEIQMRPIWEKKERSWACYPVLEIYPAVYPHVEPYPAVKPVMETRRTEEDSPATTAMGTTRAAYPFNLSQIYPATFPHFDLYPTLQPTILLSKLALATGTPTKGAYPFNLSRIYEAVYPHFDLYAQLRPTILPSKASLANRTSIAGSYPYNLAQTYPSVYPFLADQIYPPLVPRISPHRSLSTNKSPRRLSYPKNLDMIYPPVDLGVASALAGRAPAASARSEVDLSTHLPSHYPFLQLYRPAYPHLDIYPPVSLKPTGNRQVPATSARSEVDLSTHLPSHYPFFQLYRPAYPHLDIYPSIFLDSRPLNHSPPALILVAYAENDLATPSSPDRLESASLECRLLDSAALDGPPGRQFPWYDPASAGRVGDREARLVQPDWGIKMRSLADASELSPLLVDVEENSFASGEVVLFARGEGSEFDDEPDTAECLARQFSSDDEGSECSPAATSSPQAAFSSLFLPPPHSPSFDFGPASPTLNASQINQYATYASSNGYPDDVPFVLSAGLGAALGLEDSPVMDSPGYPEDDLESDDGQSQYVVIKDRVEDDDDNEPLSTSPLPTASPAPVLFCFPTSSMSDDLAAGVAQFCIEAQNQSIQRRGRLRVALSGGSMPKILAEGLLDDDRVKWDKWEIFFCDERLVPLDHPDSTFAAYEAALFSKVPIPAWQIHSIKSLADLATEPVPAAAAEEIAADYETQLLASFPDVNGPGLNPGPPRFDLVLLGMGPDGHCASLFPNHPLLTERDWWVAYLSDAPKSPTSRITFTLPLLSAARRLAFICTGSSKASALANALDQRIAKEDPDKVTAGMIRLGGHPVVWFVDDEAREGVDYPVSEFWEED